MRKFIFIVSLLMLSLVATAQEFKSERLGIITTDGVCKISVPVSTVLVDVMVEKEVVKPGVYARYAQKYLSQRAPLVERTTYSVLTATINLSETKQLPIQQLPELSVPQTIYAELPVDQTSSSAMNDEAAARNAAAQIFTIRNQRREIVSGEAGENYFGAGLQAALDNMAATEQELLEMFMGKTTITQEIKHYVVYPEEGKNQYIIARFNPQAGLLAAADLAGAPIYMQATVNKGFNTSSIEARVDAKDSDCMWFRVAAPTYCTLYNDSDVVATATLPLYEFGKSIRVEVPRR